MNTKHKKWWCLYNTSKLNQHTITLLIELTFERPRKTCSLSCCLQTDLNPHPRSCHEIENLSQANGDRLADFEVLVAHCGSYEVEVNIVDSDENNFYLRLLQ